MASSEFWPKHDFRHIGFLANLDFGHNLDLWRKVFIFGEYFDFQKKSDFW